MSTHNILHTNLKCPRCSEQSFHKVEVFFGYGNLIDYSVGDLYQWRPRKAVQNGGRPPSGNMDGEGYTECPICQKDFYLKVLVRDDILVGVEPDMTKKPHIM